MIQDCFAGKSNIDRCVSEIIIMMQKCNGKIELAIFKHKYNVKTFVEHSFQDGGREIDIKLKI